MTHCIYVLDNTVENLETIKDSFDPDLYDVHCFSSGSQYLEHLNENKPDLVLLDVCQDGMTGFEVCSEMMKKKKNRDIPVLFISDEDSVNDILKGFEVGGRDYVTRPIRPQMLRAKVDAMIKALAEKKSLESKVKNAKKSAFQAMEDSNQIGQIVRFMDNSTSIKNHEELADVIFDVMNSLNLAVKIMFHTSDGPVYFSLDETEDDTDKELLISSRETLEERLQYSTRFVCTDDRITTSQENVSVLIVDPSNDETERGRLRDLLGSLTNAFEMRAVYLAQSIAKDRRKELVSNMLRLTFDSVGHIESTFRRYEKTTTSVMEELTLGMQDCLSQLSLTEQQEKLLLSHVDKSMSQFSSLYSESSVIDSSFSQIIEGLKEFSNHT